MDGLPNTPRTTEAIRSIGLTRDDLKKSPNILSMPSVKRHYLERHHEKLMEEVRQARQTIVNKQENRLKNSLNGKSHESLNISNGTISSTKNGSTLLENERRAAERSAQRQLKQLKTKFQNEILKVSVEMKQSEKIQRKEEHDKRKKEQLQRLRQARQQQAALAAKRREEHDEQERRHLEAENARAYEENIRKLNDLKIAEQQRAREQRMIHELQAKKAEERKKNLDILLEQQHDVLKKKEQKLQRKEEQRLAAIEKQRAVLLQQHEQRKKEFSEKIEHALHKNALLLEEKRLAFEEKEQLAEERRQARIEQENEAKIEHDRRVAEVQNRQRHAKEVADRIAEEKRELVMEMQEKVRQRLLERNRQRAQQDADKHKAEKAAEHRRRHIYEQNQKLLHDRIKAITDKMTALEERQAAAHAEREKQLQQKRLQDQILAEERMEFARRTLRKQEYERDQALLKLQRESERIIAKWKEREAIRRERIRIRDEAQRNATKLFNAFNTIRHSHPEELKDIDMKDFSNNVLHGQNGSPLRSRLHKRTSSSPIHKRTSMWPFTGSGDV